MGLHMSVSRYVSKSSGYAFVKVGDKWTTEHRVVMEKYLGRKLIKDEIPHHIDESFEGRSNNDISNLELMNKAEHQLHHGKNRRHDYFVSFCVRQGRWHLYVRNDDNFKAFGYYDTKEEAIKAFETGVRINRHDERQARKYRIYHSPDRNRWRLFIKLEKRDICGRRLEKCFGDYNSEEDALKAFESGIKIDRRLHGDKGYSISLCKGRWMLRVKDKENNKWGYVGRYNTEEAALKVFERRLKHVTSHVC